jgi:hypothetical protein
MSEISKNIVSLIVSKEFHKAKTLIHEAMNNKLGILLEEKLLEYGPTLHEGGEYMTSKDHEDLLQLRADYERKIQADYENGIERLRVKTDSKMDPEPLRFGNSFEVPKPIIPLTDEQRARIDQLSGRSFIPKPIIPPTDEQRDRFEKEHSDYDDQALSQAQRFAKMDHELDPGTYDGTVDVNWAEPTRVPDKPEDKMSSSLKNIQARAHAVGDVAAVGTLIPRTRAIGGNLFNRAWQVDQAAQAVDNIRNDPAWKYDTGTATANSAAEIAKRVAMGSVFSLGLPLTGAVAGGAALAWPLAKATDTITGAKKGEGLADEIFDWSNYEPKNWVAGAKAMANQLFNNPYAGVPKDTVKPPVAAGTVRNGSGQIMQK